MSWTEPECARECVVSQSVVPLEKTIVSELVLHERQVGSQFDCLKNRILLTIGRWIQSPSDEPVQRLVGLELDRLIDLVERSAIDAGTEVVESVKGLEAKRECAAGSARWIDAAFPCRVKVFGIEF